MGERSLEQVLFLVTDQGTSWAAEQALSAGLFPLLAKVVDKNGGGQRVEECKGALFKGFSFSLLEKVEGEAGSFELSFVLPDGNKTTLQVGTIVIALEAAEASPKAVWQLEGPIYSVAEATESEPREFESAKCIVFLSGFKHTSYPFTQRRALELALSIKQKRDVEVFFLLEHFKAADKGMEKLFRQVRDSGVIFVKISNNAPKIRTQGNEFQVAYEDEYLNREIILNAQAVVVEEMVKAPTLWAEMAATLGIHLDSNGFFQADNVRNFPIYTNRRGIYVIGSAKGPVSNEQAKKEAQAAISDILNLLREEEREPLVCIETGKCAVCLTCYRSCPHGAVYLELGGRWPNFLSSACKACGICVSACPGQALSFQGSNGNGASAKNARTVIFACQNSAYEAYRLAEKMGMGKIEARVEKIRCGGSINLATMLKALEQGAENVIVIVCHHDSCASFSGSVLAEKRVRVANKMLGQLGVGDKRIIFASLSPSCAGKFMRIAIGSS